MRSATPDNLENEIRDAIPKLLGLARELTWNIISDNCQFILSEIKNSHLNSFEQIKLKTKENALKIPISLPKIMLALKTIYVNLYDVNLVIYRSNCKRTVIDVRYYSKSSLDETFRQKVVANPPMFHCKVALPPWLSDKNEKFDINWEHKIRSYRWKMFWSRIRPKNK